jgi:diguanylate cyclase (GGDEF)-like protein
MERAVARAHLPRSGDSSEIPPSVHGRRAKLPHRPPRTPQPAAWILVLVVVALVPLLVATWTFGRSYRTSEIGQVDSRLTATAGDLVDELGAAADRTSRVGLSMARSPELQRTLVRGATTTRISPSPNGDVHLETGPGSQASPVPQASVSRTALVRAGHHVIGHVTAWVSIADVLSRLSAKTGVEAVALVDGRAVAGPLRGHAIPGPTAAPEALRLGGDRYRLLRQPLGRGVSALLFVPYSKIESSVFHRELPTAAAGAVTLLALGLLAALALPRLTGLRARTNGGDWRRPVALVGDVAVAAHDPDALLPVILETALAATDADGGAVVWEGKEITVLGDTSTPRRVLSLPLGDERRPEAGQLLLYSQKRDFSERDQELARSLVAQGRIALENARLHNLVRRQAQTDELTDLANRRRFMSALEQEIVRSRRFGTPLSLVLFDLDHFKRVNDQCGHQVGDLVLRRTADTVRARIRATDLAARIGGEEFAILLPGTDAAGAVTFAENLRRDVRREVTVEDVRWPTTASFGVAQVREGMSIETLVGAADGALYQAKADGRDRVRAAVAGGTCGPELPPASPS